MWFSPKQLFILACQEFHKVLNLILAICPGLWGATKKDLRIFGASVWCGHHFLCLKRNFRKIQRKIWPRTIFGIISHRELQSTRLLHRHMAIWILMTGKRCRDCQRLDHTTFLVQYMDIKTWQEHTCKMEKKD